MNDGLVKLDSSPSPSRAWEKLWSAEPLALGQSFLQQLFARLRGGLQEAFVEVGGVARVVFGSHRRVRLQRLGGHNSDGERFPRADGPARKGGICNCLRVRLDLREDLHEVLRQGCWQLRPNALAEGRNRRKETMQRLR